MADFNERTEQYPVARFESGTKTFPATSSAAQTATLANVNGTIKAIEIITTDTEDGITYTVALTDSESTSLFSEASLADNSKHWRDSESSKGTPDADFNPITIADSITVTITPSAAPDAGEVGSKTAQVTVKVYVR